jgi:D-alanyl-D-alanine carboxypeptidase (penicillin-binding protein 5/6)
MRWKLLSTLVLFVALVTFGLTSVFGESDIANNEQLNAIGVVVNQTTELPVLPTTKAKSFIIADMNTGKILAAKNVHKQLPPASTLKALTSLALLNKLDPDDLYTAKRSDAKVYGNKVGIFPGRKYKIESIWYGLLLHSGNDAGMALAHAGGGLTKTLEEMTAAARGVKAMNTIPKSPHGLDAPGQVSTAFDLALIGRAVFEKDEFRRYARTKSYVFPRSGRENVKKTLYNTNKLLTTYPGLIAGKTGFTTLGKNTYVGAARQNGQVLIIAFMGLPYGRDALATELFDWGFAVGNTIEPVGQLPKP